MDNHQLGSLTLRIVPRCRWAGGGGVSNLRKPTQSEIALALQHGDKIRQLVKESKESQMQMTPAQQARIEAAAKSFSDKIEAMPSHDGLSEIACKRLVLAALKECISTLAELASLRERVRELEKHNAPTI